MKTTKEKPDPIKKELCNLMARVAQLEAQAALTKPQPSPEPMVETYKPDDMLWTARLLRPLTPADTLEKLWQEAEDDVQKLVKELQNEREHSAKLEEQLADLSMRYFTSIAESMADMKRLDWLEEQALGPGRVVLNGRGEKTLREAIDEQIDG